MNADKLIEKARREIGRFCIEECKAYCCRKGYLVLSEKEMNKITKNTSEEWKKRNLKKISNGKYSMYLGENCPCLQEDFTCKIHKSVNRPEVCRQFPFFVEGKEILLSPRCLAVKQGKFYKTVKLLMMQGYTVTKRPPLQDFDQIKNLI
jgi:Fe-S-cluster containining protein